MNNAQCLLGWHNNIISSNNLTGKKFERSDDKKYDWVESQYQHIKNWVKWKFKNYPEWVFLKTTQESNYATDLISDKMSQIKLSVGSLP